MEEQNRVRQPVHNQFISGTTVAIRSWMLTSGPTPFSENTNEQVKPYVNRWRNKTRG